MCAASDDGSMDGWVDRWMDGWYYVMYVCRCGVWEKICKKDCLKWPSTSWECREVAWSDRRPHESGPKWSSMQNVQGLLIFIEHRRGHHGAAQVANVPTWIAQGAKMDHIGSDFRCQTEVRTTRNCWFYCRKTNDSVILARCEHWNRYARHWST